MHWNQSVFIAVSPKHRLMLARKLKWYLKTNKLRRNESVLQDDGLT